MKIVIDPGHGGQDRANRGPTGYIEADGVLDVALRLRSILEEEGYIIKMTRDADETVSLYNRAEMANEWEADLFLSLHTNAASTPSANGIEIFYSRNGLYGDQYYSEAKRVAEIVQGELIAATGLRDRGTKTRVILDTTSSIYGRDYYAVLRRTKMPALIIEMGFHTNPTEEGLLKTPVFREKLARAIAEGIMEAYPIQPPEGSLIEEEEGGFLPYFLKVILEGQEELIEGYLKEGTFYVPIRFLENYGYKVVYDATQPAVVIDKEQE